MWAAFWAVSAGGALMPSFIRADALNDCMLEMMQQAGDDTTIGELRRQCRQNRRGRGGG